jgi:hypothetical protein
MSGVGSEKNVCRQQGINNPETYTISLCLSRTNTTIIIIPITFDGDPTISGMTGVGSDVDTGNAEICLVTANSLNSSDIVCVHCTKLILVDPARGHCYRSSIKPCESRGARPRHTAQ